MGGGGGGVGEGGRQHARIQEFFSVFFSPQLIIGYRGGRMVLLLRKLYLYLTNDPEEVHYFPGGGVSNFFQGVQMLISIETHIRTCYFPRGEGSGPPIPLWIRTWAMSS